MANVAVTIDARNAQRHLHNCRYYFPSLPQIEIQFETEMLLPELRLHQDYISRYISPETQMLSLQYLPEETVHDGLDLPDLVSEDSDHE